MALQKPENTKELRYFSRKTVGAKGKAMIWIFNPVCPECGKKGLQIPFNEENGRYKSRGKFFECIYCDHKETKVDIKSKLPIANVAYTCPECQHKGETQEEFKRNSKKQFKFKCGGCGVVIVVGKK
jgi:hypothetical protein